MSIVLDMPETVRLRRSVLTATLGIMTVLLITALSASPAAAQQGRSHELRGNDVAIYNIAGKMTVVRGSGSNVVVEVDRGGRDSDALTIESSSIKGRQTLRIIYPDNRIVYTDMSRGSRTTMNVRRDGTFGNSSVGARKVTVAGSGSGLEAHADVTVKVPEGKNVAVYVGVGTIEADNLEGDFRLDTHSGKVHAERIAGSLLVDTGSGAVTVADIRGDLHVDTGSGKVDMSAVHGDYIYVDTGSGRVTGVELECDKLEVYTGSGGIDVERVQALDIKLDTGSGSVNIDLIGDVKNMVIDTGSGGVTVRVPSSLGAEIEIDVGSGGINVNVPIEYERKTRSYVRGTVGDGMGRIYIDTGSGSVRIHPR